MKRKEPGDVFFVPRATSFVVYSTFPSPPVTSGVSEAHEKTGLEIGVRPLEEHISES